jgi:hypothetical protein
LRYLDWVKSREGKERRIEGGGRRRVGSRSEDGRGRGRIVGEGKKGRVGSKREREDRERRIV